MTTQERPILFSGPLVCALLDGRKTQTRRVVKPQPESVEGRRLVPFNGTGEMLARELRCPYGVPGDRLWQREPITTEGWYYVRGLLDQSLGGDARLVYVSLHDGEMLWGFSPSDDPEAVALDGGPTQSTVEWKRPGDRLWVRETWASLVFKRDWESGHIDGWYEAHNPRAGKIVYDADDHGFNDGGDSVEYRGFAWRPSIFMPRWASRLTLELTDVRVERVQDISEADAIAEGCSGVGGTHFDECESPREQFSTLWDSINGKRGYGWDANPWVWALTFKRVDA